MECKLIRIPRWLVAIIGVLFSVFHAALGISTLGSYPDQGLAVFAVSIYLVSVLATILFYRGVKLPIAQALVNLVAASLVPLLINNQLNPAEADSYTTWYVIGIATLMAATAVRRQRLIAWLGTGIMVLQVIAWAGFLAGWQTGLAGATMLVFAGHTISAGIEKASRETIAFTQQALEIEKEKVANVAARAERRTRLESALRGARPMLDLIQNQKGKLSVAQKLDAKLLEASLRDEIRGRGLMTASIRDAARSARLRGIEVIILDEGGLDQVEEPKRSEILNQIAKSLDQVHSGRVTLRAPIAEAWKVTFVATRNGVTKPDIWLKF
jgi:hypothetical protein